MKLKPQLPKTAYPDNIISILTIITLTGAFLFALVAGVVVHDALRMLLVLPMGMVVFIRNRKQPLGLHSLFVLVWFKWIGGFSFLHSRIYINQSQEIMNTS